MLSKKHFLLTDVLPYEIPLIYSNKQLYQYIGKSKEWDKINIDYTLFEETEPYNFLISKNDNSSRMISLIHPISQLYMLKFIEWFDSELIDYCKMHSIFSIRYPDRINSKTKITINKLKKEIQFLLDEDTEVINNDEEEYIDSYFSKTKYVKITDFYRSKLLRKYESKYKVLLKMDIQNCFYNIYTHSIDWAYLGEKSLAKDYKHIKNRFSSLLDRVMQCSNYGETNGIVVGPEFSRCVAEIVLTRIDNEVYRRLSTKKIVYKNDYDIARFMDDIFVFCNESKVAEEIKKTYQEVCLEYRLSINESKITLENRPFLRNHLWVPKVKGILKHYLTALKGIEAMTKPTFNIINLNIIEDIRAVLVEYEEQKHSIVSYILTYFERKIRKLNNIINKIGNQEVITNLLCKLIDLIHYILIFSVTSPNVIKYAKLCIHFNQHAQKFNYTEVSNLLFKKALELLKYHQSRNIELLNLIIAMKNYSKDIPEGTLLNFLERSKDYLTLSSILFYIDSDSRRYKYKRVKKVINDSVQNVVNDLNNRYFPGGLKNSKNTQKLISDKNFYIIHDFYSNPLITHQVKTEIKKIKDQINSCITDFKGEIFKIFVDYIKNFDKPFMNWRVSLNDLTKNIIEKTSGIDSRVSG
jgi:hypothetical protein